MKEEGNGRNRNTLLLKFSQGKLIEFLTRLTVHRDTMELSPCFVTRELACQDSVKSVKQCGADVCCLLDFPNRGKLLF
jgi:hypothetical protein